MKRLLTCAVFAVGLLSLPAFAGAQDFERETIQYGVVGGINLNNVQSDLNRFDDVSNAMVGYQAGIQGAWRFAGVLSLNPELVFSRRGWDTEGNVFGQSRSLNYNFSYMELPVLLSASAEVIDGVRPKLFAGPHAALFLDGSAEGGENLFGGQGSDIDGDQINDLQFGVTGGIGANFDVGNLTLTSDVRYQRNVTGIFENTPENVDSVEHESWQLTLGFLF